MIRGLRAEFKKIFTVRSTYILMFFTLVFMMFYNFYIIGFKQGVHNSGVANGPLSPNFLMQEVTRAGGIAAPVLFSSIVAVLLMAHEYRYNTIMYTLTNSNSRNKALAAKIIAVTGFAVTFALAIEVLAPALSLLGLHLHHVKLAHQSFYYGQFFWRVLFYTWAYAMVGVLLAIYFRNVVASVVSLFLLPFAIEPIVALALNMHQQQYLPFTALIAVLNNGIIRFGPGIFGAAHSAAIVVVYLVVGWIIAWTLFLKRDAN